MANYKAVANGNWSDLATWQDNSTGVFLASTVLPGASDVVYFNNFTVQMDVDVTVLEIRNNNATGVTAGGTGVISTSRNVNANFIFTSFRTLISITATSPNVINIVGNIPGTGSEAACTCINQSGNCTLNFVGDIVGGAIAGGGQNQNVTGINVGTGATLNCTGNIEGGKNTSSTGIGTNRAIDAGTNSIINVVGNVSSGTGTRSNSGIRNLNNATISITGNISNVAGNDKLLPNCGVLLGNGTTSCSIVGNVTANSIGHAVFSDTNPVKLTGNLTNGTSGDMAFRGAILYLESANQWEFRKENLTTNTLYAPGVATGFPATNNVRTGIVYGPTSNLTGTCAVPPAAAVSVGVPVDNTVGTGYLNATDIWNVPLASITTPNSIGERLKDASTVQTTGAQLAAFLP
jgi:hypothetical protein